MLICGPRDEFCSAYGHALDGMGATVHATPAPRVFRLRGVKAEDPDRAEDRIKELLSNDLRSTFSIVPGKTKREPSRLWLVETFGQGEVAVEQEICAQHAEDALRAAEVPEPGEYRVRLADGTGKRWLYRQDADGAVALVRPLD